MRGVPVTSEPSPRPSPASSGRGGQLSQRAALLLVALLGASLFLPGLGSRDLWNPDEPRYAEVAREMLASGQYLVPHLNGEVYTQKPPLQFWAMCAASLVTGGINEVSARLPAALAAIGTLLLVFLLGERFFGRRAAWLAVAAFATCGKILWQGRIGQIDMLLTALVTLGVWFWARGETENRPGFHLLFFVAAGFATVAKGPVGLLPPLLAMLAYYAWMRDRAGLARLRPWWGLLIWAAVVLAWLLPAGLAAGGDYLQQIVFKQNVTRYADPWHHHQPFYYYLTVLPADFFPWSFLLPTALVVGWRRFVREDRGPASRGFRFALCWVVVTVLFFSISPAKRTVYVLTMFPGLALLVGAALDQLAATWPRERRWLTVPLSLLAGLLVLLTAAVIPVAVRREEVALLPPWLPEAVTAWLAVAAAGALGAFFLARKGDVSRAAGSLAAGMGLCAVGLVLVALPSVNDLKSSRPVVEEYLKLSEPAEPYAIYPRLDAPVLFYTRRIAVWPQNEEELRAFVAQPGKRWLFIEKDDLERLEQPLPMVEVERGKDPGDGYVVMRKP